MSLAAGGERPNAMVAAVNSPTRTSGPLRQAKNRKDERLAGAEDSDSHRWASGRRNVEAAQFGDWQAPGIAEPLEHAEGTSEPQERRSS